MTDKQIIIYKKECYNEPYCSLNQVLEQLKRKEQECDMWKNFTIDNGAVALKYQQQLDQLKEELAISIQENEEGREINAELKAENEDLKKANKHIEHNRNQKADKLMRIEKLITACSTGYTDEFIQELLVILHEVEPIKE